jgi:hypothetical protein
LQKPPEDFNQVILKYQLMTHRAAHTAVTLNKPLSRLGTSQKQPIFRHYSLIATLVGRLYSDYRFNLLASHPVFKLQQDVTDDRSAAAPLVSNLFQLAKHSIATLNVIVRTDFATNRNGTLAGKQNHSMSEVDFVNTK